MMGMWAVLVFLCLSGQAQTQLGEGEEEGNNTRSWRSNESDDSGYVRRFETWAEEEEIVLLRTVRHWKPVQETYLGCLEQDANFTDSIRYINLTQVMEMHNLESVEAACYEFCHNKAPLSVYFTFSPAFNGNMDACGCHLDEELNLDDMVDDEGCDSKMDFYRVFCGPFNIECYSRSGGLGSPSHLLLALPLLLSLLSYFGFNR